MKHKIHNKFGLSCFFAVAVLGLGSIQAAVVVSPTRLSADSDISINGTLVSAVNFSGFAQTVNGVTFSNVAALTGATINTGAFDNGGGAPFNTLSADYQNLVTGAAFNGTNPFDITLSGLTVNQTYELQVFAHDTRAFAGNNDSDRTSIIELNGTAATLDLNGNAGQGGVGQFAIFEFVATSDSQIFSVSPGPVNPGGTDVAQINAFQLRAVPEPSSTLLMGLGALTFALRRKR